MPIPETIRTWQVPVGGPAPDKLPAQWASAFGAVGRDLRCRRYGRAVSFGNVAWELTENTDGSVLIGIAKLADDADLYAFSQGRWYTLTTTAAQAAVWIAEAIQDDLTGHEWVQWPLDGRRLLVPEIRNGLAQWVDMSTGAAVSPIGELCD
jgi:hypothetical protein